MYSLARGARGGRARMSVAVAVALAALAIAALVASAGPGATTAAAQEPAPEVKMEVHSKVIPNRAGTPRNPQGVKIRFRGRLTSTPGFEPPIVTHGYALFPRNGNYNGDDFPKCDPRELGRTGPDACPKRSRIGFARGTALADTVVTHPEIEIFNGGNEVAYAYVTLYNPSLVQEVVPARIEERKRGKWKYKVSVRIPVTLQVVAGVPIYPRSLRGWVGRGNLIETTSCPRSGRWPYRLKVWFYDGRSRADNGSTPCKPAKRAKRRQGGGRNRRGARGR